MGQIGQQQTEGIGRPHLRITVVQGLLSQAGLTVVALEEGANGG